MWPWLRGPLASPATQGCSAASSKRPHPQGHGLRAAKRVAGRHQFHALLVCTRLARPDQVPTLVVRGEFDTMTEAVHQEIVDAIPHAHPLVTIPRAGPGTHTHTHRHSRMHTRAHVRMHASMDARPHTHTHARKHPHPHPHPRGRVMAWVPCLNDARVRAVGSKSFHDRARLSPSLLLPGHCKLIDEPQLCCSAMAKFLGSVQHAHAHAAGKSSL